MRCFCPLKRLETVLKLNSFMKQVKCRTSSCNSELCCQKVRTHGLGSALKLDIVCSGCEVLCEFQSSPYIQAVLTMLLILAVSLAMQVAFIAGGCMHADYKKILGLGLGIRHVS